MKNRISELKGSIDKISTNQQRNIHFKFDGLSINIHFKFDGLSNILWVRINSQCLKQN